MGIFDKLRGELVDIVEWIDDSRSTLAWRFPRYQNEIKHGAQLIVREGQEAKPGMPRRHRIVLDEGVPGVREIFDRQRQPGAEGAESSPQSDLAVDGEGG